MFVENLIVKEKGGRLNNGLLDAVQSPRRNKKCSTRLSLHSIDDMAVGNKGGIYDGSNSGK